MSALQSGGPSGVDGLVVRVFLVCAIGSAFLLGRLTSGWGAQQPASATSVAPLHGGSLRQPLASGDGGAGGLPGSTSERPWHVQSYTGRGAYVEPGQEHLVILAQQDKVQVTDKITKHTYHTLYSALWDMAPGRTRVRKVMEIGLGCKMYEGAAVGASARLWKRYFPHASEVWFAEYNAECIKAREAELQRMGIKVVVGDQEDPEVLNRWVKETGGDFDVIIDDGGHQNAQQWQSFVHLFPKALRPGGVYIMEDINASHRLGCDPDNERCEVVIDHLLAWMDQIVMRNCTKIWDLKPKLRPAKKFLMPPGIRMIQCSAEVCAIYKCFENDPTCFYPGCVNMAQAANTPWNASIYPKDA